VKRNAKDLQSLETLRGRANYYNDSGLAVKCHRFCAACTDSPRDSESVLAMKSYLKRC